MVDHIHWLRWVLWFKEETLLKHKVRRDRLTLAIMEEHKVALEKKSGGGKEHFVNALVSLQEHFVYATLSTCIIILKELYL